MVFELCLVAGEFFVAWANWMIYRHGSRDWMSGAIALVAFVTGLLMLGCTLAPVVERLVTNAWYGCYPWAPARVAYHPGMTICPGQMAVMELPFVAAVFNHALSSVEIDAVYEARLKAISHTNGSTTPMEAF